MRVIIAVTTVAVAEQAVVEQAVAEAVAPVLTVAVAVNQSVPVQGMRHFLNRSGCYHDRPKRNQSCLAKAGIGYLLGGRWCVLIDFSLGKLIIVDTNCVR